MIEEYDRQGVHRTATDVDLRSAHWLADRVRAMGLEPTLEGYEVDRVDPGECYLEVGGRRIEGVPLFDSMHSEPEGLEGRFVLPPGDGEIVLLGASHDVATMRAARRESEAKALVLATSGHSPGLSLLNAFDFEAPFGPPALQVSSVEGEWLRQQAGAGAEIRLVAAARRTPATAYNVTADLPGADHSLPPLAVNTPRSGWWQIAAERGGGLACWLEVMRALAESGSERRVFFAANTGHELGFTGMDATLDAHPELTSAATWLHFGANIGAATGSRGNLVASTEGLGELARTEMSKLSRPMSFSSGPGGGEMMVVHRRGGRRYLALTNDNAYFHMREDRFPESVDVDLVTEFARAFSAVALRLAQSTSGEAAAG